MPSSSAVRTPLHAALSAFPVAGERLLFINRRTSRRLARASSTAALVSGLSHHSGIRGIRLSIGSTVCAASRIASVNSLAASGAVVLAGPFAHQGCVGTSRPRATATFRPATPFG